MSSADYMRPGFQSVTPYLIVQDASQLIEFLIHVFDAQELRRDLHASGKLMNAELRIGTSVVELAEASDAWPAIPAALHVYVPDTDAAYARALAAGATVLYAPEEMSYGERSAGVRDAHGNHWFLATYRGEG